MPVCGHVVSEVHVHLLSSVPTGDMVIYTPCLMEILQNMLEPSGGMMASLDALGHGLMLDEGVVTRFRI